MNVLHELHSDVVALAVEHKSKLQKYIRLALYIVIGVQCFLCLERCSSGADITGCTTLTIDEDMLYGNNPIEATSKVIINPRDCNRKRPYSPMVGIGLKLLLQPWILFNYLIHGLGFLLFNLLNCLVWLIEGLMWMFWCFPKVMLSYWDWRSSTTQSVLY